MASSVSYRPDEDARDTGTAATRQDVAAVFKRVTLQMDSHQFSKFCADARLFDGQGYTKTDSEILFREVKNVYLRKISFVEFVFALEEVAKRSGRSKASVMGQVAALRESGPVFTSNA